MLDCICFMSFNLFIYLFFLILTDSAIFCLMHYSFPSVMKKNVWHSIEQRTLTHPLTSDTNNSKTRVCAKGRHFKHMTEINLCRKTKKYISL